MTSTMTAELTGLSVLIVEDEAIVAMDLAGIVEDAGAQVIGPALTLAQAEHLSDNSNIAVAILDVRLGRHTIASVATKLFRRGVPIVFHTGHGSRENLTAEWPGSQVLLKPARREQLLKAVIDGLRASRGGSA